MRGASYPHATCGMGGMSLTSTPPSLSGSADAWNCTCSADAWNCTCSADAWNCTCSADAWNCTGSVRWGCAEGCKGLLAQPGRLLLAAAPMQAGNGEAGG